MPTNDRPSALTDTFIMPALNHRPRPGLIRRTMFVGLRPPDANDGHLLSSYILLIENKEIIILL